MKRLKITTISARDTPIPQVEGIISKLLYNGRANWSPDLLNQKEWCLYIRFVYDNVLYRSRFSYKNRLEQITTFFTAQQNKAHSDFLNFGVSLLNITQYVSKDSLIYEPLFQKFVYPFIQNQTEQDKINLLENILLLLEPKYKMNEFAAADEFKRTEDGPCLDMLEMVHFLFLMGYSNVGLKYFRDQDLPFGSHTLNTTRMVQQLINQLASDDKSRESFIIGLEFFVQVLGKSFNLKNDESYMNINLFSGETEQEKIISRSGVMSNLLVYYAKMQEDFNIMANNTGNPHLEQFFIKGGVMLCTFGIKEYLIGDVDLVVSDDEAVNEVASYVATEAAKGSVSQVVDYINVPKLVASKNQELSHASDVNIFQNFLVAVAGETLCPFYIEIDKNFISLIQEVNEIYAVDFTRRLLI
jgi:hypothetical protein